MLFSVLLFAGVEKNVFTDMEVHHLEEGLYNRVCLGILATVVIKVVVLSDEIAQLGPDLGGGAGIGGRAGGDTGVGGGVVRTRIDEVDISGVHGNIDQAGPIGAVTLEVTVIDVGSDTGGSGFPGSADDSGEMVPVFCAPVG